MSSLFYKIKQEVRILGVDDASFRRSDSECLVVGTVFRGGRWMDGVMTTWVQVDGVDATDRLSEMVNARRFRDLRVIMIDGIGFAGFNTVDIHRLNEETGLPVIVVVRKKPDFGEIKSALNNLSDFDYRWRCIESAGQPMPVETGKHKNVYIQFAGISLEDAAYITRISSTRSMIPEPIRVAHLIGQGVMLGQSRGKA